MYVTATKTASSKTLAAERSKLMGMQEQTTNKTLLVA